MLIIYITTFDCLMMMHSMHFSIQPVLHNWSNKGHGKCSPVCGMVHIKPLLLIGKSSPCVGAGFLSCYLNGPLSYVWCHITVYKMCWEIAQWVHPMKDRSDDPSHHERTLYLWATSRYFGLQWHYSIQSLFDVQEN